MTYGGRDEQQLNIATAQTPSIDIELAKQMINFKAMDKSDLSHEVVNEVTKKQAMLDTIASSSETSSSSSMSGGGDLSIIAAAAAATSELKCAPSRVGIKTCSDNDGEFWFGLVVGVSSCTMLHSVWNIQLVWLTLPSSGYCIKLLPIF